MKSALVVALLTLATFSAGSAEYILTGQLDLVSQGLNVSEAAVGQLVTVFSLAYGLLTPLTLALTARMDRRTLLLSGLGLFALTNLVSWWLPSYGALTGLRVVMATATGIIVVTALGLVLRLVAPERRASGLATVLMGFTGSLVLGVPAGRVVAEQLGWTAVFPLIAGVAAVTLVLVWSVLPRTAPVAVMPLRSQLALLRDRNVLAGLTVTFLWLSGYSILYTYLTPYLIGTVGLRTEIIGLVLLLFGIASLAGTQLGGALADRVGFFRTLAASKALHVAVLFAIPLLLPIQAGAVAAVLVWSVAAWASASGQQLRVSALDPQAPEILLGFNQSVMQLAIAAGAALGGVIVSLIGLQALPAIGAVVVLASLVLLAVQHRRQGGAVPAMGPGLGPVQAQGPAKA